ncbi:MULTISPECIES: RNA polymerase sigma factor [Olivibacter]|uniref:RNA polymerase sigma factor n=1 Tax=Olivibacter oleidegradans TaxID=760123 RepID=A0ABV6HIE2_9SPHI|nr:RNA polymerase sigma-70 factor [Olivibacter jilunii]
MHILTAKYIALNDQELCSLLKKEDYGAFSEIYNRNWEKILRYVSKVISIDSEDAQDVVQEIFLSLWKRKNEIQIDNLISWLYAAARKQALFHLRTNSNRKKYLLSLSEKLSEISDSLNEQLAESELAALIDREIDKLPAKMREIFILSRKENLSYKEIAEKLGISDKTVKKQINNTLKKFRIKIDADSLGSLILVAFLLHP